MMESCREGSGPEKTALEGADDVKTPAGYSGCARLRKRP